VIKGNDTFMFDNQFNNLIDPGIINKGQYFINGLTPGAAHPVKTRIIITPIISRRAFPVGLIIMLNAERD